MILSRNVVMDVITFHVNRLTTSGLQILLHGLISRYFTLNLMARCHMIKIFHVFISEQLCSILNSQPILFSPKFGILW